MSISNGPQNAEIKMTLQVPAAGLPAGFQKIPKPAADMHHNPWETFDGGQEDDRLMVTRMILIMLLVMVT